MLDHVWTFLLLISVIEKKELAAQHLRNVVSMFNTAFLAKLISFEINFFSISDFKLSNRFFTCYKIDKNTVRTGRNFRQILRVFLPRSLQMVDSEHVARFSKEGLLPTQEINVRSYFQKLGFVHFRAHLVI